MKLKLEEITTANEELKEINVKLLTEMINKPKDDKQNDQ